MERRLKLILSGKKSRLVLVTILLLGATVWVWEDVVKDRVIPKRFGVVKQGQIYRSGQLSSSLVKRTLIKYKIGVIVSLSGDSAGDVDREAEKQAAAELGVERTSERVDEMMKAITAPDNTKIFSLNALSKRGR